MKSEMTRRGFIAVATAVAVKGPVVFKPRGPGLSAAIAEGINPEWDGTFRHRQHIMYECYVGTGWVTEFGPKSTPYWHGLPPVVKLDLRMPWEK